MNFHEKFSQETRSKRKLQKKKRKKKRRSLQSEQLETRQPISAGLIYKSLYTRANAMDVLRNKK